MIVPYSIIAKLPAPVKIKFKFWRGYMYRHVRFNRPQSPIHAHAHCERVLLYALMIGYKIFGDDSDKLDALAQASIFHDTQRLNDYMDTGHGARAAVYYNGFTDSTPEITKHDITPYLMRYHDLDDRKGRKAITERFGDDAADKLILYDIFKDADALDRWRLGSRGLDKKYLRTTEARNLTEFSKMLVWRTMNHRLLGRIDAEVRKCYEKQNNHE